jgi:hypothetical protein
MLLYRRAYANIPRTPEKAKLFTWRAEAAPVAALGDADGVEEPLAPMSSPP